MTRKIVVNLAPALLMFVAACGGGGGGSSVPTSTSARLTPSRTATAIEPTATPPSEPTQVQTVIVFATPSPTSAATPAPTATATAAAEAEELAFIVATDFQRGSFATVSLDEPRIVSPARENRRIHQDAVARTFGGLVYVVNRFNGDNIQVLDPANDFATTMQCSVGNGANPHDIVLVNPTKAYVTRFGEKELYVVNPSVSFGCNGFLLGSIDLSPWADADGYPEMDQMAIVGDRLYVSLEELNRRDLLRPAQAGAIAVIDMNTDTVIDAIPLSGENPFAQSKGLVVRDGAIVMSETGKFGVNDGGIERVDLTSGRALGFFITEEVLGGDLTDFVIVSDELGYAVISLPNFDNSLVRFNPQSGEVIDTVLSGPLFISDIELDDRDELFAADRTATKHGIRIFRASDGRQLTAEPLSLLLPPFDIVFLR